jgi:hypothetical protein
MTQAIESGDKTHWDVAAVRSNGDFDTDGGVAVTGAVTGASVTATGAVSGATVVASAGVSGLTLTTSGAVIMTNIPQSDPAVAGQLYADTSWVLSVSAGA